MGKLISCAYCGSRVSHEALTCPKCGEEPKGQFCVLCKGVIRRDEDLPNRVSFGSSTTHLHRTCVEKLFVPPPAVTCADCGTSNEVPFTATELMFGKTLPCRECGRPDVLEQRGACECCGRPQYEGFQRLVSRREKRKAEYPNYWCHLVCIERCRIATDTWDEIGKKAGCLVLLALPLGSLVAVVLCWLTLAY